MSWHNESDRNRSRTATQIVYNHIWVNVYWEHTTILIDFISVDLKKKKKNHIWVGIILITFVFVMRKVWNHIWVNFSTLGYRKGQNNWVTSVTHVLSTTAPFFISYKRQPKLFTVLDNTILLQSVLQEPAPQHQNTRIKALITKEASLQCQSTLGAI